MLPVFLRAVVDRGGADGASGCYNADEQSPQESYGSGEERMRGLQVKAHVLRDYRLAGWHEKIVGKWHYRDLCADASWRDGWISFDSVAYHPRDACVYCGLNSIDADILYRFDPRSETFTSLNSRRWADRFDVKIHRTLLSNPADGCLYFGTSMLHEVAEHSEAGGGKLVRYDPASDTYEILGIPVPMLYIQSIAADFERGWICGFTYPAEAFFEFNLHTRQSRVVAYTGNAMMMSQPHNVTVDRDGWFWGTYAETRAWDEILSDMPIRLFKYHPATRKLVCFDYGLPRRTDRRQLAADPPAPADVPSALAETRHHEDFGFCDSLVYDGRRYLYAGTVAGVLCRIDTSTDKVEKIAHVMATGRFPALAVADDGTLYGGGGMNGHTQVMRWRPGSGSIESFYPLRDPALGEGPARIHELAVAADGTLYLAENDNHVRSSYLWSARLP